MDGGGLYLKMVRKHYCTFLQVVFKKYTSMCLIDYFYSEILIFLEIHTDTASRVRWLPVANKVAGEDRSMIAL